MHHGGVAIIGVIGTRFFIVQPNFFGPVVDIVAFKTVFYLADISKCCVHCFGTMYIGGRVLVETTGSELLGWHSISGFTHSSRYRVRPCGTDECEVEATTVLSLDGMLAARVAGLLVRGFIGRNLEATLESLRHYAEYGD